MPIRIDQLAEHLQPPLAPVWLIAGPEELRVQEVRDAVLAAARREGYEEREVLHASANWDWDHLAAAGVSDSLFASRRIVDVRLPGGKVGSEGSKALKAWCGAPPADVLLVLSSGEWDGKVKSSAWARAMDEAGVVVGIWALEPDELPSWIDRRMRRAGLKPDRDAVAVLCERIEGNLLAAAQEIERLVLLEGPGPVTADTVSKHVDDSARFSAFRLVNAALVGRLDDSLRVVAGLRSGDDHIQAILGAVQYSLKNLAALQAGLAAGESESVIFRRLGIWGDRQGPLRRGARRLDPRRVDDALRTLARCDLQSKGRMPGEAWQTFENMVADLAGAART